jgi:hypothetical protein
LCSWMARKKKGPPVGRALLRRFGLSDPFHHRCTRAAAEEVSHHQRQAKEIVCIDMALQVAPKCRVVNPPFWSLAGFPRRRAPRRSETMQARHR